MANAEGSYSGARLEDVGWNLRGFGDQNCVGGERTLENGACRRKKRLGFNSPDHWSASAARHMCVHIQYKMPGIQMCVHRPRVVYGSSQPSDAIQCVSGAHFRLHHSDSGQYKAGTNHL
jgi:hypothetical protein